MRGLLMGLLVSLLLLGAAKQATACPNDREAYKIEKFFRSLYNNASEDEDDPEYSPGDDRAKPLAFLGMGAVLLVGAGVGVMRFRSASRDV